jgi:hypothetical protein
MYLLTTNGSRAVHCRTRYKTTLFRHISVACIPGFSHLPSLLVLSSSSSMAEPSAYQALLDLLEEIFSIPCIAISSDSSASTEYRTTTLLLQSARSAPLPQLVELILHLLLSHPPFTHTAADLLISHPQRFLVIWNHDHETSSHLSVKDALTPAICLNMLRNQRLEFQRLGQPGFRFVSELLLSCLERLSPEGSSRSLNIRGWVHAHGEAVAVLEELLYSVPPADWLRLDTHAEYALAMWKCLKMLCSGATWWSMESGVYRANLERLGKCVCSLPIKYHFIKAKVPQSACQLRLLSSELL